MRQNCYHVKRIKYNEKIRINIRLLRKKDHILLETKCAFNIYISASKNESIVIKYLC